MEEQLREIERGLRGEIQRLENKIRQTETVCECHNQPPEQIIEFPTRDEIVGMLGRPIYEFIEKYDLELFINSDVKFFSNMFGDWSPYPLHLIFEIRPISRVVIAISAPASVLLPEYIGLKVENFAEFRPRVGYHFITDEFTDDGHGLYFEFTALWIDGYAYLESEDLVLVARAG